MPSLARPLLSLPTPERALSSESQALGSSLALPRRPSGLGQAAPLSESSLLHLVDEGTDLGIPRTLSRMAGLRFQLLPRPQEGLDPPNSEVQGLPPAEAGVAGPCHSSGG